MQRKKMILAAALMAALIPLAVAQDSRLPQASLDRELNIQAAAGAAVHGKPLHQTLTPPKYCKPCLFYAGDFDSNASDANGLANEFDITVSSGAAAYTPSSFPRERSGPLQASSPTTTFSQTSRFLILR